MIKLTQRLGSVMLAFSACTLVLNGCSSEQFDQETDSASTAAISGLVTITPQPAGAAITAQPVLPSEDADAPGFSRVNQDFSVKINDTILTLQTWDDEVDLIKLLGTPRSQNTRTLQDADTLTGSFLKEMKFAGLEMQLFSPKQNGKSFWIMNMRLTDPTYVTARGLRVGMVLGDLKMIYPNIQNVTNGNDDPDQAIYRIGTLETLDYAEYTVENGIVKQIDLYNEIP